MKKIITNSNQSQKSYWKYKSENGRTWTSEYIRCGIRCHGEVSIPCRPIYPSVFKKPEVVNELHRLHDNFVLVPADKASNNIVFVCKKYYYECLLNELRFTSSSENPTYTRTNLTRDEILQNHISVWNTFDIPKNHDQFDLPYLYCIPKLHKNPYKQRYIAGSSKCSTKPLSLLLINY